MPRSGRYNRWITLSRSPQTSGDSDGFFEALVPAGAWASLEPLPPAADGRTVGYTVTMRFHAQVNMDTRIVYNAGGGSTDKELFVKGFQDVGTDNVELRLICEEIIA